MKAASAGASYFATTFVVGFLFGTIRTLFLVPRVGDVAAVSIEAPLILGVSWVAAGICLRLFSVPKHLISRLSMGGIAFILLMLAEAGVSIELFGRSLSGFAKSLTTDAGMIGLASQIAFALIPALQNERS